MVLQKRLLQHEGAWVAPTDVPLDELLVRRDSFILPRRDRDPCSFGHLPYGTFFGCLFDLQNAENRLFHGTFINCVTCARTTCYSLKLPVE